METLDSWLKQATRRLSQESAAQVRKEIQEHYDSALEAAVTAGQNADLAEASALQALGNPQVANREYRKVLITASEARMLRESSWEAKAFCSRQWLRWLLLGLPAAALLASAEFFLKGSTDIARDLLAGAVAISLMFAAPFLPVYTPARGRWFRTMKWIIMTVALVFTIQWGWLLFSCLWPIAWIEWKRSTIRRKLPVSQWPKELYL
jgi:hypothetical protein